MSPELSFAEFAGAPCRPTRNGRGACCPRRAVASASAFPEAVPWLDGRPRGTQPDDVLDALVGAWTAQRLAAGRHTWLGGETDETGLRMEIIV